MVIENPELLAAEEWYSANYRDSDGNSYEIVLVKSHMHGIGYKSLELANIPPDSETQQVDDPWERAHQKVASLDLPDRKPLEPASPSIYRGDEG